MRPRHWIIVGIVSLLLIALCVGGSVAGYFFVRDQVTSLIEEGDLPPFAEPTPRPRTTPVPPPEITPALPEAIPTEVAAPLHSTPAPSASPRHAVAASLVPGSQALLEEHPDAPHYRIDAEFMPEQHRIEGTQTVAFTNTEEVALDAIFFRLYVNANHYNEGEITVDAAEVDGAAAQTALEVDDTALEITLPQPLAPGESVELRLDFTTTIPTSGGGYGIFNERDGIFTMYNWHPELAVYEDGDWLLHPISAQGDPTNTDAANYEVTLTAPATYTIISSGTTVDQVKRGDHTTHEIVSALTRNFVLVASDQLARAAEQIGDVVVSSYYFPEDAEGGEAALDVATESIEVFSDAFGPYPYNELDVTQAVLGGGAAGMEATGLIIIGRDLYDSAEAIGNEDAAPPVDFFPFVIAHEVAHQWWYGVVGSDAYGEPWLDEGLTNWSATLFFEEAAGDEAGDMAREMFTAGSYLSALNFEEDQRLDQTVEEYDDFSYGTIVYGKGAVLYDALRAELGDDTFFRFLRQYYEQHQFERADSDTWLETLNETANQDMTPFYRQWVEGDGITADDVPLDQP